MVGAVVVPLELMSLIGSGAGAVVSPDTTDETVFPLTVVVEDLVDTTVDANPLGLTALAGVEVGVEVTVESVGCVGIGEGPVPDEEDAVVVTLEFERFVELTQGAVFWGDDQLKREYSQVTKADHQSVDLGVQTGIIVEVTDVDVDKVEEAKELEGAPPPPILLASAA